MKKIIFILIVVIIVIAAIGYFSFSGGLGKTVTSAVEKYAPRYTQTAVTLDGADISPVSGKGALTGLVVGNPEGYQTERAIYMGDIELDMDPTSVFGDAIIVERVYVRQPEFTYERKLTTSNIEQILANVREATGAPAPKDEEGDPVRLIIHEVVVEDGKVQLAALGREMALDLPALSVADIGVEEGGVTPNEAALQIMNVVLQQVIQTATTAIASGELKIPGVSEEVNEQVQGAGQLLQGILKGRESGQQSGQQEKAPAQ